MIRVDGVFGAMGLSGIVFHLEMNLARNNIGNFSDDELHVKSYLKSKFVAIDVSSSEKRRRAWLQNHVALQIRSGEVHFCSIRFLHACGRGVLTCSLRAVGRP